jgi:hypothetical protein
MRFIIHSSLFQTGAHYLHDSDAGTGKFVTNIPDDAWVVGDADDVRSVDMFAEVIHHDFTAIPELQRKIFSTLGLDDGIPWHLTMPKRTFKQHLRKTLDAASEVLKDEHRNYYESFFIPSRRFLHTLGGIPVDKVRLRQYLDTENNRSIISALTTCLPEADGYTRPIIYDFTSSKTGRFKVRSGPRVLTLKRIYRDIFTSRWPGGQIVPIDFKSLEARIALTIGGQTDIARDPYAVIAKRANVERDVAKVAMLSTMFGSSTKRLIETTKLTQLEATLLVAYIKDLVQYDATVATLSNEYSVGEQIHNFYGRPLLPGTEAVHVLYNNYIQSTGVDVAALGFSKMVEHIDNNGLLIQPLFIVHDCLYIDVHPDYNSNIEELQSVGSVIPSFPVCFYSSTKQ